MTWPTSTSAVPWAFAVAASSAALSRTCATEPGADSTRSVRSVWIESIEHEARPRLAPGIGERLDARLREREDAAPGSRRGARRAGAPARGSPRRSRRGRARRSAASSHASWSAERRLADARLAAEQHHRARHEAAAEHAVELARRRSRRAAPPRCRRRGAAPASRAPGAGPRPADRRASRRRRRPAPRRACPSAPHDGAAPEPARLLRAALGADVDAARAGHRRGR